jgi:two-component system, chemotaxis family, sensor kinase Cph1
VSFGVSPSPVGRARQSPGGKSQGGRGVPSIQSCAALLVVREPDLVILQASENAALVLGTGEDLIGASLRGLAGELANCIRAQHDQIEGGVPVALRCRVGIAHRECDVILHRPASGGLAVELEPAGPAVDVSARVETALQPILAADSLPRLTEESARVFQELTGYDRALVFRFDEDGQGEVIAERRKPGIPSCLGQHFGDAEAPPKAHLLIARNRIRHLVDAEEPAVPVRPSRSPLSGRELDLSCSTWRRLSPVHLQFLGRLGVRGALVASLLVGGRLWGLIVCHHRTPRFVHYPIRVACELLAEAVATRITALEARLQARSELGVLALERSLAEAIARHGDWTPALLEAPETLLDPVGASGAVVAFEGKRLKVGHTPDDRELGQLLDWLDRQPRATVFAAALSDATDSRAGGGLLATPLSATGGEYLVWLRAADWAQRRTAQAVRHPSLARPLMPLPGCDLPAKAEIHGRHRPWSAVEQISARLIGESIADVIQQFRAVRVLIAQAQLAQASAKVSLCDQPILITDPDGAVLVTTPAWQRLFDERGIRFGQLLDLASACAESWIAEHQLRSLMTAHRPWRGQICLQRDGVANSHFLIRAEPVLVCPGQVLGFVVALSDCAGQVALRDAGARFQEEMLGALREGRLRQAEADGAVHPRLVSALAGNASRAALDSSESPDAQRGGALVAGVETSLARTCELLSRLVTYAGVSVRGPD